MLESPIYKLINHTTFSSCGTTSRCHQAGAKTSKQADAEKRADWEDGAWRKQRKKHAGRGASAAGAECRGAPLPLSGGFRFFVVGIPPDASERNHGGQCFLRRLGEHELAAYASEKNIR